MPNHKGRILPIYFVTAFFKKIKLIRNRPWGLLGVLPGRYEHHVHIKNKVITVIGRECSYVCCL
jgi:hypothetical protein